MHKPFGVCRELLLYRHSQLSRNRLRERYKGFYGIWPQQDLRLSGETKVFYATSPTSDVYPIYVACFYAGSHTGRSIIGIVQESDTYAWRHSIRLTHCSQTAGLHDARRAHHGTRHRRRDSNILLRPLPYKNADRLMSVFMNGSLAALESRGD